MRRLSLLGLVIQCPLPACVHGDAEQPARLTVTSVSSNKGACRSVACQLKRERSRAFMRSMRSSGLQHEQLGNFSSWRGWLWMSQQYEAHAASVAKRDPGHLLVAIDSSDGVSQAQSPQAVIAAYHRVLADSAHTSWRHDSSPPLVMVLETGCVDGFCVSVSGHVQVNASPALPGNIHVNGGFVMGPAIAMREMWSTIATTNISCCHRGKMHPQLGMGRYALRYPMRVAFDVRQHLAAVINLHDPHEWRDNYRTAGGIVTNRNTGAQPAFLHFPGQQFPGSWHIYRDEVLSPRRLLTSSRTSSRARRLVAMPSLNDAERGGRRARSSASASLPSGGRGVAFDAAAWQRARRALPATAEAKAESDAMAAAARATLPLYRTRAWPVVKGAACAPISSRVVFMLTSTPTRAVRVSRVLENMRSQSRTPDQVVLAIPRAYARPPLSSMAFELPPSAASDPLLRVVRLEHDAGPLTKYLGLQPATGARADDIVVVGDDDVWYGNNFIEDFACAVAASAQGVVVSSGRDKSCEALGACIMGFRGVAMRAGMLDALRGDAVPSECFLADDVFVTHHFLERRFAVKKLKTRTKYTIDGAFAWSNESINIIHRREQYTLNRACVRRLLLHKP